MNTSGVEVDLHTNLLVVDGIEIELLHRDVNSRDWKVQQSK